MDISKSGSKTLFQDGLWYDGVGVVVVKRRETEKSSEEGQEDKIPDSSA